MISSGIGFWCSHCEVGIVLSVKVNGEYEEIPNAPSSKDFLETHGIHGNKISFIDEDG